MHKIQFRSSFKFYFSNYYIKSLALSIVLKETGLFESKQLFFPDYDNEFLTIDIDLSMKYNQEICLQHEP